MTLYEKRVKKLHDHVVKNMKRAEKEAKETDEKKKKEGSKGAE